MIVVIILGTLLLGAGVFLVQFGTSELKDSDTHTKQIFIGFLLGMVGSFLFILGCLYKQDESFSSKDYYLDYKIVTTQIGDGTIVRDTTYILTRK